MALLAIAYGVAGFGYIVTATFLPVIARQALPGSIWLDLFWPLFGLGVAMGALLTIRFAIGAAGLGLMVLLLRVPLRRRDALDGLWLGLVLATLFWLQTDGLRFTTTSKSGFITGLYVIFTPMVALLAGDRLRLSHGLGAFVALVDRMREATRGLTLREIIEHMLHESGLVTFYQTDKEGKDRLENLEELVNAAEAFVTQEGFGKDAVALPVDEQVRLEPAGAR